MSREGRQDPLFDLSVDSGVDTDSRRSRTVGSALWSAWGDAIGFISELTDEKGLKRRTRGAELVEPIEWKRRIGGRNGVQATLPAGCYSDDTQLRLATSRAIGSGGFDVEAFAKVELTVWPSYALGGGRASKAAASNLARSSVSWFANFYDGWQRAGGNGAAMRIQPHVWAAPDLSKPDSFLRDVVRNTICTHGDPVGIVGAVIHARCVAHAILSGSVPSPSNVRSFFKDARSVPELIRSDDETGDLWLGHWERSAGMKLDDPWSATIDAGVDALGQIASLKGQGMSRYGDTIDALRLRDEEVSGSGLLTALAAIALCWCESEPQHALALAANVIGSDTDTIATMAGAILGATSSNPPAVEPMDSHLIVREADRLVDVARGNGFSSLHYPDLLRWSAPKSQADALGLADGVLAVAGLGRVVEALGEPMRGSAGDFLWQWVVTDLDQTLLVKRRHELSAIPPSQFAMSEDAFRQQEAGRKDDRVRVAEAPNRQDDPRPSASEQSGRFDDARPQGLDRGVELDRVLAFLSEANFENGALGYAVRRVARDGSPDQLIALAAMIRDLLRKD